jgi:hypothetical protein
MCNPIIGFHHLAIKRAAHARNLRGPFSERKVLGEVGMKILPGRVFSRVVLASFAVALKDSVDGASAGYNWEMIVSGE